MVEQTENKCNCEAEKLSILKSNFWDLWTQKLLRNIASMKFQWLVILYVPVVWGMFHMNEAIEPAAPWISAELGLGFLGGGFITLATSRIIARTKLTNGTNSDMDTDK